MTLFDGNNKAPLTFGTAHFLISYLLCALASSMVNVFSGFVFKAAFFCNEFYKRLPWPNDLAINALAIQLQLLKFKASPLTKWAVDPQAAAPLFLLDIPVEDNRIIPAMIKSFYDVRGQNNIDLTADNRYRCRTYRGNGVRP